MEAPIPPQKPVANAPAWELLLLPALPGEAGPWLLVVEASGGALRHLEALAEVGLEKALPGALSRALRSPSAGGAAGRPRWVSCLTEQLPRLEPALKALGLSVRGAAALPAARKVAARCRPAPGLVAATLGGAAVCAPGQGWGRALGGLLRAQPWAQGLGERRVQLRVEGAALGALSIEARGGADGAGRGGPAGLVLRPAPTGEDAGGEAGATADELPGSGEGRPERWLVELVELDLLGSILAEELRRAGAAVEGKVLCAGQARGGALGPLSGPEAVELEAACAAVAAFFEAGARVEAPEFWVWPEQPGARLWLEAAALPAAPAPSEGGAAKPWSGTRLALFTDAERAPTLIALLEADPKLDAVLQGPVGWEISLLDADGDRLGIGELPLQQLPERAVDGLLDVIVLEAPAGSPADMDAPRLWSGTLPVTLWTSRDQPMSGALNDPDPRGLLRGASWRGPPQTWPKSSDVLLSCVSPLVTAKEAGVEPVERLVRAAAWIWTLEAEGRSFDEIALHPAPLGLVGPGLTLALLRRKKRWYGLDRRPIYVRGLRFVGDELKLDTTWTMALPS